MPIPERNSIQFGEQLICYLCVPFLYVFLSESIKRSPGNLWCTVKTVTGKNSGRRTGNADQGSYKGGVGANNRSCYKNEEQKEEERRTQFEKNCSQIGIQNVFWVNIFIIYLACIVERCLGWL